MMNFKIRRLARAFAWVLGGFAVLFVATTVITARAGDPALWPPAAGAPGVEVHLVSHGYHSGLAIPRAALAEVAGRMGDAAVVAVAQRFGAFSWIEIGWGDEGFYRLVPTAASLTIGIAARALFRPGNSSVLHVVGFSEHPRKVFSAAEIVPVRLSPAGFERLVGRLDAGFARVPGSALIQELGTGLYGPSLFYRGVDTFNIFNVCNHWVARLLSVAGLPTAPVLAILPQGLMLDLKWRSGLVPLAPGAV
jgi:uncharacterized protein (TIGR02117 family)